MTILIITIIILSVVTVFSVQNAAPVAISFIFWKFEASLAIVIFLSVTIGIIVGGVIVFSFQTSRYKRIQANNKGKGSVKD
jgi:lipopolysaccharide assembly protein A